jgi:hypothetical protein
MMAMTPSLNASMRFVFMQTQTVTRGGMPEKLMVGRAVLAFVES